MAVSSEKEMRKAKQTVEVLARACRQYEQLVKKIQNMTNLEAFDILYDMGKYQIVVDGQKTLDEAIKHNGKKLVVEFLLQKIDEETISVTVGDIRKVSTFDMNLAPALPDVDRVSNAGTLCGKSYGVPSQASRYSEKLRSMPGRYNLGRKLGEGTLGAVYYAEAKSGGTYAAKIIPKHGRHLPQEADIEFLRTVSKNKRIVEYLFIIEPSGSNDIHILMEYMHIGSLKAYIERNGSMDQELVKTYTKQILEGLDFLHSKNIIHQDLKPANLLLKNSHEERLIKIADFGSSKFASLKSRAGQQGRTPKYTDPGVSLGREVAGRRSDIWSLGVIVIEMYTGVYPWAIEGEHPITVPHILDANPPQFMTTEKVDEDIVQMAGMMLQSVANRPYASTLLELPVFHEPVEDNEQDDFDGFY